MNVTKVSHTENDSTLVEKRVYKDTSISLKAKGVYSIYRYLQQHKGIASPSINDIIGTNTKEGRTAIAAALKELRSADIIAPAQNGGAKTLMSIPGFIYLLHAEGTNRYKIGITSKPKDRIQKINKQSPFPIKVVNCFTVSNMQEEEFRWHERFKDRRVYGEWFELSQDQVNAFLATAEGAKG